MGGMKERLKNLVAIISYRVQVGERESNYRKQDL